MATVVCDYTECRHNYLGTCSAWIIGYKKPNFALKQGGCSSFTTDPSVQPDKSIINTEGHIIQKEETK